VTARERKRRRLIREAEALERKAAAVRASAAEDLVERAFWAALRPSRAASWPTSARATRALRSGRAAKFVQ